MSRISYPGDGGPLDMDIDEEAKQQPKRSRDDDDGSLSPQPPSQRGKHNPKLLPGTEALSDREFRRRIRVFGGLLSSLLDSISDDVDARDEAVWPTPSSRFMSTEHYLKPGIKVAIALVPPLSRDGIEFQAESTYTPMVVFLMETRGRRSDPFVPLMWEEYHRMLYQHLPGVAFLFSPVLDMWITLWLLSAGKGFLCEKSLIWAYRPDRGRYSFPFYPYRNANLFAHNDLWRRSMVTEPILSYLLDHRVAPIYNSVEWYTTALEMDKFAPICQHDSFSLKVFNEIIKGYDDAVMRLVEAGAADPADEGILDEAVYVRAVTDVYKTMPDREMKVATISDCGASIQYFLEYPIALGGDEIEPLLIEMEQAWYERVRSVHPSGAYDDVKHTCRVWIKRSLTGEGDTELSARAMRVLSRAYDLIFLRVRDQLGRAFVNEAQEDEPQQQVIVLD